MASKDTGRTPEQELGPAMDLAVRATTDPGIKRELNEDHHAYWIPAEPGERERRGVLLVLADGMGGARAGEVASRLAVDSVVRTYRESSDAPALDALRVAVESANRAVHDENRAHPELNQMGTTCTAAVIVGDDLLLAHVGDCRAYRVGKKSIEQLTRDHTLVAQLVEQASITPEEARVDPRRNLITRSLGQNPEVKIDVEQMPHGLAGGDTLLICSDGLHGVVEDYEIGHLVHEHTLDDACRELVRLACERGGPDNITMLLARFEPVEPVAAVQAGEPVRAGEPAPPAEKPSLAEEEPSLAEEEPSLAEEPALAEEPRVDEPAPPVDEPARAEEPAPPAKESALPAKAARAEEPVAAEGWAPAEEADPPPKHPAPAFKISPWLLALALFALIFAVYTIVHLR